MTKPSATASVAWAPAQNPAISRGQKALPVMLAVLEQHALYQTLLEQSVFPMFELADKKAQAKFRRILASPTTLDVLTVMWKESPHVTEADLRSNGVERTYSVCAPLNCHRLAKDLADNIQAFDKTQKRIAGIVQAGAAHDLIERREIPGSRTLELRGTPRLHALMCAYSDAVRDLMTDLISQPAEAI